MWLVTGVAAILFAVLNLVWSFRNKDAKWFRFLSMALTCLTLWDFYRDGAFRIVNNDIDGLMDIMPTASKALLVCTIGSILINAISLFRGKN